MILGITGRVGTGKSFAGEQLNKIFGYTIIELDSIGHQLLKKSQVKQECVTIFGTQILNHDGEINRQELGNIVFQNANQLLKLNNLLHPLILKDVKAKLVSIQKKTCIVGALINEIGLTSLCDLILVIDADDDDIMNISGSKFKKISIHQKSRKSYLSLSPYHIINPFDHTFIEHLKSFHQEIFKK